MRLVTLGSVATAALLLSGCGVAKPEPDAAVKPVQLQVSQAKFSKTKQISGDDVTLSLTVKNIGTNPAPGILVQLKGNEQTTLSDPADETRMRTEKDDLPDAVTRSAWFVDDSPDRTPLGSSALYPGGRLDPGRTRTMRWSLSAQRPGTHTLEYQVFAGQTDAAAKATGGNGLTGSVTASIADK